MADNRTNEQIAAETLAALRGGEADRYDFSATRVVAALAAAGRLVTPEHDAQVWDEAGRAAWGDDASLWPFPNPYREEISR